MRTIFVNTMAERPLSQQFYPNPDRNFVLHGAPPFYNKGMPGYLTNSMLTDTTKNLTQHELLSKKYEDDPQLRGSLRTISRSLNRVSGDIRRSLLKENDVDMSTSQSTHFYTQRELNEALRDVLNKTPSPVNLHLRSDWYIKPIHLTSSVKIPVSEEDMLATKFFPVTLGESKSLEMVNTIKPGKRNVSRQVAEASFFRTQSKRGLVNDTDFLTAAAPHIKLARLRMEKLRIEEEQYLELKRQAELERIRGPRPKWYELKTPQFHLEASKNNELLRNSDKWDDLLQYRENLINATKHKELALSVQAY
ncbi:uncharacterized protein LOC131956997 isoform X2 [Physella acuta]|uniref:uncharacterized protein LOC131956997 isoform X2 n=1 Tax=Physella acuta TaxID=109671 RepID=UPI0027DB0ACB|nr:uncharacterized protein LOC131956997 isoform X2 [Physella acuta]